MPRNHYIVAATKQIVGELRRVCRLFENRADATRLYQRLVDQDWGDVTELRIDPENPSQVTTDYLAGVLKLDGPMTLDDLLDADDSQPPAAECGCSHAMQLVFESDHHATYWCPHCGTLRDCDRLEGTQHDEFPAESKLHAEAGR